MLYPDTLLQGRYRIVDLIARGGMGAVYRARDERLGSTVALKQTLMADPALRAAFEREARLLAGLQHPALPVVSDHFTEDGGQFLVMQYIHGDDLAARLKARGAPFPPDQVLRWADALLDALAYLHGHEPPVIHRDIKPQNLKLAPHGGLILLDFGLAKGVAGSNTAGLSLHGYTPQYAPLEQIQGSGTDARSDLYSLAATMLELLGGAPPPDALTRGAAVFAGQPDPLRPLLTIQPAIPPHAAAVLEQALALNAAARPASALAMQRDLRLATSAQAAARPQGAGIAPLPRDPTAIGQAAPPPGTGLGEAATGPTVAIGQATPPPGTGPGEAATGPTVALGQAAPPPGTGPTVAVAPSAPLRRQSGLWLIGCGLGLLSLLLVAVLAFSSGFAALFGGTTGPANPARPTTAPAVLGPGTSFADPVAYAEFGQYGPLRLRVLATQRGREAWNTMYKANQFNDVPVDGAEYFLVQLEFEPARGAIPDLYPRLAGERGILYPPKGVSPAPLAEALDAGGPATAWVPFIVGADEGDLVLQIDAILAEPDLQPLFLAADEGARIVPDPTLEQIVPDEIGVSHSAPAPLGTSVASEDYVVTVLATRRGPEVLAALIERFAGVERPREGYEYALVHLRVRYIGDGGSIGWTNIGPSYVAALSATAENPATEAIEHPDVYVAPEGLPELDFVLLPGGQAEGWTVLELPVGAEDMVLVFSVGYDPAGLNTRYFALS